MRTIYIDCLGVRSADEVWRRYLDAARPEGAKIFGCNLDAFWDAIEGGGPGWPGEVKLVFTNTSDLAPLRLPKGGSFLKGLRRIAREAYLMKVELT